MTRSKWIPAVLWALLIEILTTWPHPPTFGAPDGSDQLVHASLYAVFSYLVTRAAQPGRPSPAAAIVIAAVLFAWSALDEWHQLFIDGRTASVSDWVADATGVVLGLVARTAAVRNHKPSPA